MGDGPEAGAINTIVKKTKSPYRVRHVLLSVAFPAKAMGEDGSARLERTDCMRGTGAPIVIDPIFHGMHVKEGSFCARSKGSVSDRSK